MSVAPEQAPAFLTEYQQTIRRDGIGSSEIAAIVGLSPYRSALNVYLEKIGEIPPFAGNIYTRMGNALEPVIAEEWSREQGAELVSPDGTFRHPRHPIVFASPDRFILSDGERAGVLEVKHTSQIWDAVPDFVQAQVAWQMATVDLPYAYVAVLDASRSVKSFRVERDRDFEANLIDIAETFWERNVKARVPPPADGPDLPYLKERFPKDTLPPLPITPEIEGIVAAYREAKRALDAAERLADGARSRLIEVIGEHSGIGIGATKLVTYSAARDSQRTDWQAVATAAGATAEDVLRHTKTVPGSRRLLLK